jgi:hypothetical protein
MEASSLRSRSLDDRVAMLCKQIDGQVWTARLRMPCLLPVVFNHLVTLIFLSPSLQISLFEAELAKCKLDLGVDRNTDAFPKAGLATGHADSSSPAPFMNLSYQGPVITHRRRVDIDEW